MTNLTVKKPRASTGHSWAVSKTMQMGANGAIKLTRRYGDALLCVRYRISPDGSERLTTVELAVECTPIQKKSNPLVWVKIYPSEAREKALATSKGAWFNGKSRLWRMHRNDAIALGLASRIARFVEQN